MKEIGERLREARENMNLEISEVATDLKLRPSQIENIENGNMDSFSDVLSLKMFIKEYSKYLGLDYEDMVDDFNEYLFDYTSKVSLNDIKQAKQKIADKKNNDNRIASPYTMPMSTKGRAVGIVVVLLILIVLSIIILMVFITRDDFDNEITLNNHIVRCVL